MDRHICLHAALLFDKEISDESESGEESVCGIWRERTVEREERKERKERRRDRLKTHCRKVGPGIERKDWDSCVLVSDNDLQDRAVCPRLQPTTNRTK